MDRIAASAEATTTLTPAMAYALAADLAQMARWRPGVRSVSLSQPGLAREGMRVDVERAAGREVWRIVHADPPWGFAAEVVGEERGRARSSLAFEGAPEGARVVRKVDFDPVGHERWFRGWATKDLEHQLREEVDALCAYLESAIRAR